MSEEERLEANAKVAAARLESKIQRNIEWIKGNATEQIFKLEVRKRPRIRGDMLMGIVFEQVRHCGFKIRYLSVNWGDELYRLTLAWESDNLIDNNTDRLEEWFGRALGAADFDLRLHDREKGSSWKESSALFLFNKMMGHVNKMMDPNTNVGQVHAVKVANYALMIATRLAGDNVAVEAKPKKTVIRELIHPYAGHMESNVEFGPPVIAGEAKPEPSEEKTAQWAKIEAEKAFEAEMERKAEPDPIVETGRPPLDLGPLPNGLAKEAFSTTQADTAGDLLKADLRGMYEPNGSEDEGYYCPWCEHTAKLGVGCRGKICCILCGKPIDSRFAKLLKKARQFNHIITKKPITSAKMAEYLGTSSNWAGQVLAQLGWKSAGWRKGLGARWNPPKEDGK